MCTRSVTGGGAWEGHLDRSEGYYDTSSFTEKNLVFSIVRGHIWRGSSLDFVVDGHNLFLCGLSHGEEMQCTWEIQGPRSMVIRFNL